MSSTGWLCTGDAILLDRNKALAMMRHLFFYKKGAKWFDIATLTAPHHGSIENSDKSLYDLVKPSLVVICGKTKHANDPKNGKHPNRKILRTIDLLKIRYRIADHSGGGVGETIHYLL